MKQKVRKLLYQSDHPYKNQGPICDPALEALLVDMVNIPTENPPGREAALVDYLQHYYQAAGLEVHRVPCGLQQGRDSLIAILRADKPAALSQIAGDVSAACAPSKASDGIIFTGHVDVVPVSPKESERWESDPFKALIKDGMLYGRGSTDMKSGLAAASYAICELARKGLSPTRDIALVATVDEEDSMMGSRSLIGHELLQGFAWVVVCEPTSLKLCTKSRGRSYGMLHIEGQTAHGSRPESGCNALLLAHEFISLMMAEDLSAYDNEYGQSFWRPLGIQAGVDPWVIPDACELKVDARLTLGHDPRDIQERIAVLVEQMNARYEGRAQLSFELIDAREPWETPSCFLTESCLELLKAADKPVDTLCFTGTTDGTPLRRDGREAVIWGPGNLACAHQENERVSLAELQEAYELYTQLMLK